MKKDKMKLAGLLLAIACVSCGAGGVVAGSSVSNNVVVQAEDAVEYSTYNVTKIGVAGTQAATAINIYSLAGDALPKDKGNWNDVYSLEEGSGAGVLLNDTALTGIKMPGDLYVPLGRMPEDGDALTIDGTLYNANTGVKLVFNNCKLYFQDGKWVDTYIDYAVYEIGRVSIGASTSASALYLNRADGEAYAIKDGTWAEKLSFLAGSGVGVTINGTQISMGDIKIPNNIYVGLGVTAAEGDVLKIGGTFYNKNLKVKYVVSETTFVWNGSAWKVNEYDVYTISKIAAPTDSNATSVQLSLTADKELPAGNWNRKYTFEAGSGTGLTLGETALTTTDIKQPGKFYIGLGATAAEGDVLTIDGTYTSEEMARKFVFENCQIKWNGSAWVAVEAVQPEPEPEPDPEPDPTPTYNVVNVGAVASYTGKSAAGRVYLKPVDGNVTWCSGSENFLYESGTGFKLVRGGDVIAENKVQIANRNDNGDKDFYIMIDTAIVFEKGDVITFGGTYYNENYMTKYVFTDTELIWDGSAWVTELEEEPENPGEPDTPDVNEYTEVNLGKLTLSSQSTGSGATNQRIYMKGANAFIAVDGVKEYDITYVSGTQVLLNGEACTYNRNKVVENGKYLYFKITVGGQEVGANVGDKVTIGGVFVNEEYKIKYTIEDTDFWWNGTTWQTEEYVEVEYTIEEVGAFAVHGHSAGTTANTPNATQLYMKVEEGTAPAIPDDGNNGWNTYFVLESGDGWKVNGTSVTVGSLLNTNSGFFVNIANAGVKAGDVLTVSGTFSNATVAKKYVIAESKFIWTGSVWMKAVDATTYEIGKVAIDAGSSATAINFKKANGEGFEVTDGTWAEKLYFIADTGVGVTLNGTALKVNDCKIPNNIYLGLEGNTAAEGDVLVIGGTFYNANLAVKYVIEKSTFTYTNGAWVGEAIEEPTPDPEPEVQYTTYTVTKIGATADSTANVVYLYSKEGDGLPKDKGDWDNVYAYGTDASVKLNDTALNVEIKMPGDLYVVLGTAAVEGDILTINGTFYNATTAVKLVFNDCKLTWNGSAWVEIVEVDPEVQYTIYELGEMIPHANSVTNNNPRATQLYMKVAEGQTPAVPSDAWHTYFVLESGEGWKVNGVSVSVGHLLNTEAGFFTDIAAANIKVGDVLTVSGTFSNEATATKYVISESKFTWNGAAWEKYVYVEYATHEVGSLAFHQVASQTVEGKLENYIYFVRADGKGFPIPDDGNTGWTASFTCKSGVGITLNGEAIKAGIKFPGGGSMFVNVYDKAPAVGDELKVGGTFFNSSVAMEIVVTETTFKWDGSAWVVQGGAVTPDPDPTPDPDVPEIPDVEFTTYTVTKVGANSDSSASVAYIYSLGGDKLPKDKGNWDDVYAYASGASIKLNNTAINVTIKMPGDLYIPLGVDANTGDILTINGTFYNADNAIMLVFENCQLKWNGTSWVQVDNPTEWNTVTLGTVTVHKHSLENGGGVGANKLYFTSPAMKEYPVNSWSSRFALESGNGWTLNGNSITVKEFISADNHLYITLAEAVQEGDLLTVSGTFVYADAAVKYVIEESTFTWNGSYWESVIEYESYEIGTLSVRTWDGANNYMWLRGSKDPMDGSIPKPNDGNNGWTATFKWKDGAGVQINGKEVAAGVKYPGEFFMALPKAPKVGDVLTIGGTFYNDGLVLAYIVEESSFMWDGTTWVPVIEYTDYEVGSLVVMPNQTSANTIDVKKADNGNFEMNGAFAYLGGSGNGITINGEAINSKEISVYGNMLSFMIAPEAKEGDVLTIGGTFYNVQNATRYIVEKSSFIFTNGAWNVYESNYTEAGLGEVTVLVDASTDEYLYLASKHDNLELPVNSWDDEFVAMYGLGVTLNGQVVEGVVILSVDNALYVELPEAVQEGDELVIGGTFVCETQGVLYYVTESSFTWTGYEWEGVVVYETKELGKVTLTNNNAAAGKLTVKGTGMSNESFEMLFESGIGFTVNGVSKEVTVMNNGGKLVFSFDDVEAGAIVKIGGTFYSKAMALKYVIAESEFVWDGANWDVKYEQYNVGPVVIIVTSTSKQDLYLAPANGKLFAASGWEAPLSCVSGGITVNGTMIDMNNTVKVPDVGTIFARLTSSADGVEDGSVVVIGGVFRCVSTGIEYVIEESTFIYENGAWKNLLDSTKAEKVTALEEYLATFNEADYYVTEWSVVQQIVVEAKAAINASISKFEVEELYNDAIAAMDAVATMEDWNNDSESIKAAAKAELDSYVDVTLYREADAATITATIAQAKADIDAATNWAALNDAKVAAKAVIDALWTAAEWDVAEATVAAAKAELDGYKNVDDYLPAEQLALQNIIAAAYADIDAAIGNPTAIANIVKDAKARMDAVKTAEQVEAEQMVVLQAKAELESYKSQDDYNAPEWAEIQTILANAYANIDAAIGDDATIATIVENAKAAMDKVLNSEEADAKAFEDAKYDAQQEIKNFVNSLNYDLYSDEAMAEITAYVEAANAAIDAATNIDDFAVIVAEFKANVESVEKLPTTDVDPNPEKPSLIDQIMGAIPGCSGVVGGIAGGVAALGIAAVTLLKKKEDDEE